MTERSTDLQRVGAKFVFIVVFLWVIVLVNAAQAAVGGKHVQAVSLIAILAPAPAFVAAGVFGVGVYRASSRAEGARRLRWAALGGLAGMVVLAAGAWAVQRSVR